MSPEERRMNPLINPCQEILSLLEKSKVAYRIIEHQPVYTSEQAEAISGLSLKQGAKVLLLSAETQFVLAILPGDERVDTKKVAQHMKVKRVRFATEEEVRRMMHCELGACYPFGSFIGVRTIADPLLCEEEIIAFNPGVNNKTIIMGSLDYFKIANPEIQRIVKE